MNNTQNQHPLRPIAHIRSDFPTKFGIPRQSGIISSLKSTIVFEPEYRNPDALRGMEEFSHLWLIWQFSGAIRDTWSPTVRPPRLGGNERKGVFATRSPFRPNPLGLSCVQLVSVTWDSPDGPLIHVCGADLMDGTPIYDIKPYVPYSDSHPEALGSFSDQHKNDRLKVEIPDAIKQEIPASQIENVYAILSLDPRPAYQDDPDRVYGFPYAGMEIKFTVKDGTLQVCSIEQL